MQLTINVDTNVAQKLKMISKLGGLNSEELDATLSRAVNEHLSRKLVDMTRDMLISVGVHEEFMTSVGTEKSPIDNPVQEFNTPERLGGDLDQFDEINKTSQGSLLDTGKKEPVEYTEDSENNIEVDGAIEEEPYESDEEYSISDMPSVEEAGPFFLESCEDDDDDLAGEDSWQASLMDDDDQDYSAPAPKQTRNVQPCSYDDSPVDEGGFGSKTPDVLPVDLGISGISVDNGDMSGSVQFMAALLQGAEGDTSLRNSSRRVRH